MNTIKHQISAWKNALFLPNKNDVLLNLVEGKNAIDITSTYRPEESFHIEENTLTSLVYKQHTQHIKETGAPIFGIASGLLHFSWDDIAYKTPFLLANSDILKNRFNPYFEIQQIEDFYVNPLLLNFFELEELPLDIEETISILSSLGLKVKAEEGIWAGNFHPHRFVLQKELDGILEAKTFSEPLKKLFGEVSEDNKLQLSPYLLFPADESQKQAIEMVKSQDIVLQGPPGTGKSQVIANLIAQTIGKQQNALLVTEKEVALEVIYDQMNKCNLHHFCVLYHHKLKSKLFVQSLLETWRFIEQLPSTPVVLNQQAKLLQQGLDLTLERIKQEDLIGGISLTAFKAANKLKEDAKYLSNTPEIKVWEEEKKLLQQLQENGLDIFGAWLLVKTEKHNIKNIEKEIEKSLQLLTEIVDQNISYQSLQEKIKASGIVSLFFYQDQALPIEVFQADSRLQKRFFSLYNTLKTLSEKEELLRIEEENWSKKFSLSELNEYILALGSTNRFNLRTHLTKRKLSRFTQLNLSDGKKALENLVELNSVRKELIEVRSKLRKQNLPDDLITLDYIHYAIRKINSIAQNSIQNIFQISEKERIELKRLAPTLNLLNTLLHTYFDFKEETPIMENLKKIQSTLPLLIENAALVENISSSTKNVLLNTHNLTEAESVIYNSHYKKFKGQFPSLAELTGEEIELKVEQIIHTLEKESKDFAKFIQQEIKVKFEAYHILLQTPSRKLSEEEKIFKQQLRKGKSILVKAFDRKRVFPTVRELLESEAKHWITLLKPVFLCSPYSVAKSLPLNLNFDLTIFDEASQIPISHIVGSVQRSKRIVVSGDQQQMAPQFYFQKKEAHQTDALHHASFYLENALLTHHYRSKHPQLIAFSNQYFYENKLKTFPTVNPVFPIEVIDTNGVFENRINVVEAKIAADLILKKVESKTFNFGLVAFSQSQLQAILTHLPANVIAQLENKKSIFIQSLENVQGDQCEHLIISLGYAKNAAGEFHKRFGPLNQDQGHRRLNVLLSRAQSKITFIRSVRSKDFSISSNEGVEMLRKLMLFLEQDVSSIGKIEFPKGIKHNKDTITIYDLSSAFKNSQSLIDFYRTSVQRAWKVKINF